MTPFYSLIGYEVGEGTILSVSLVDQAGFENDRLEIIIDDRNGAATVPPGGAPITPVIGYRNVTGGDPYYNGVQRMGGMFLVDEVRFSGPPRQLSVTAHASDMAETPKQRKERSWHETTIGGIVTAIAGEHGWTPRVDERLMGIPIRHRDQTNQSDVGFLTTLAMEHDAIFKVSFNNCYLGKRDNRPVVEVEVPMEALLSYEGLAQTKSEYSGVRARWHDYDTGEDARETVGTRDNLFILPHTYPSKDEATSAASSKMASLRRENETFTFTCVGDPRLMAEGHVILAGPRPGMRTRWVLDRVTHRFDNSGYTTSCDCITPEAAEEE